MSKDEKLNAPSSYDAARTASYFDELGMGEWDRLLGTPVDEVSLYLHTHYLKRYAPPGSRVLEIGAGAGRFTQVLAGLETRVLVADISQVQLDLNRRHARQYGFAHAIEDWRQVDVCDMAQFEAEAFDCVVAYGGPFSYVLDERDVALQECMRVLKRGGVLLASVMSLWGSAHRALDGVLAVPVQDNVKITHGGDITPETLPGHNQFFHMFRASEFRAWLTRAGLTVVAMSASNCLSLGWGDFLQEVKSDGDKWGELLRMELEACAEQGCLDMGTHIIGVAKK